MSARFSCSACGREYPWKPELAGRNAKCKCGQVMTVPKTAPAAAEPEPDVLDFADDPIPATPVRAAPANPVAAAAAAAAVKPAARKAAADSGYRCPSCQADMTPGAPICVSCGFDLRTGQRVRTAVEADDAPVAATPLKSKKSAKPAGKGRSKRGGGADESSGNAKQVVVIAIVAVLAIGGIFAAKQFFKKDANAGPGGAPLRGDDAAALEMFKENERMEGMEFVNSNNQRALGSWTNSVTRKRIEQWYGLGCAKVWAFNGQIVRNAILELPAEPEKRAAIFGWCGDWFEQQMKERPTDVGQKYIILDIP